jgi:LPXTG-site transpeptidase (sortase) family protein
MNLKILRWFGGFLGLMLIGWGAVGVRSDARSVGGGAWAGYQLPQHQTATSPVPAATASGPTPAGLGAEAAPPNPTADLPSVKSAGTTLAEDGFLGAPDPSIALTSPGSTPDPPQNRVPDRILIPAIRLDAPIVSAQSTLVQVDNQWLPQWLAPDKQAAGWHTSSAPLGTPGNTVLNGHHNEFGEVFGRLVDLKPGDLITVSAGQFSRSYRVSNVMILPERSQPLQVRLENARWLAPTADERLTLVTCWPKWSNTHRLVIVASPVDG